MKKPDKDAKPWYREPWPWILMAGPATVVVAGIYTAWLAVQSNDGLVDDDYYKQGLAVNQRIARDEAATALGLSAELMVGADLEARLFLTSRGENAADTLLLRIAHPTRAGADQHLVLKRVGGGLYAGRLSSPLHGRWHVQLEDEQHRWRLSGDWDVEKMPAMRMPAVVQ